MRLFYQKPMLKISDLVSLQGTNLPFITMLVVENCEQLTRREDSKNLHNNVVPK